MANSDMCLEAARKAFPNDEKMRVAYMLGFNEGYDRANEQPSLPSNLDEAAEENFETMEVLEHENIFEETHRKIFKAGAEWMARQGDTREVEVKEDAPTSPDFDTEVYNWLREHGSDETRQLIEMTARHFWEVAQSGGSSCGHCWGFTTTPKNTKR